MSYLFMICGRAGSKGIKNKNIRSFLGYPLPLYAIAALEMYLDKNPDFEADIAVNTDSQELASIVTNNCSRNVYYVPRKDILAGDRVAKRDVIIDTLVEMERITGKQYTLVVDLDITSPLRRVEDIENLIKTKKEKECDVVFSAVPSRRNPYFNMVKKTEKGYERAEKSEYVARQEAPEMFDMNGSLYAYDTRHLKAGKGVLEGYNEMIPMYDTGILDLDRESDFELMEVIAKYLYTNKEDYGKIYQYMKTKYVIIEKG